MEAGRIDLYTRFQANGHTNSGGLPDIVVQKVLRRCYPFQLIELAQVNRQFYLIATEELVREYRELRSRLWAQPEHRPITCETFWYDKFPRLKRSLRSNRKRLYYNSPLNVSLRVMTWRADFRSLFEENFRGGEVGKAATERIHRLRLFALHIGAPWRDLWGDEDSPFHLLAWKTKYCNQKQCEKLIDCLLRRGFNLNQRHLGGQLPIHGNAMADPCLDRRTLLIKAGADVTLLDDSKRTALHHSCRRFCFDKVEQIKAILSQAPQIINWVDRKGWTALDHNVLGGPVAVTTLLLQRNADPSQLNDAGLSPFHRVLLAAHRYPLLYMNGLVDTLLNQAHPNHLTGDGETPLHCLMQALIGHPGSARRCAGIAEKLITAGANLRLVNGNGKRADEVIRSTSPKLADYLVYLSRDRLPYKVTFLPVARHRMRTLMGKSPF